MLPCQPLPSWVSLLLALMPAVNAVHVCSYAGATDATCVLFVSSDPMNASALVQTTCHAFSKHTDIASSCPCSVLSCHAAVCACLESNCNTWEWIFYLFWFAVNNSMAEMFGGSNMQPGCIEHALSPRNNVGYLCMRCAQRHL